MGYISCWTSFRMAVHELAALTWEMVRHLSRSRLVALLPTGAIEAHGPHLPLATDVIIAGAMARAGAAQLSARGCDMLLLPALPYAPAPFAESFEGTLQVGPATVTALVTDVARSLARHGCSVLAIANAHHDPTHVAALREAARRMEPHVEPSRPAERAYETFRDKRPAKFR